MLMFVTPAVPRYLFLRASFAGQKQDGCSPGIFDYQQLHSPSVSQAHLV